LVKQITKISELIKNKTKLVRKRTAHRTAVFLQYYLNNKERKPIFILAARRTGSNLLLECLNSIPEVSFASEILNKKMYYGIRSQFISKAAVLRHIKYSISACKKITCGAKLIKAQLDDHRITLKDLENLFPIVSLKIAETTHVWQCTKPMSLPCMVTVNVQELLNYCIEIKLFYQRILSNAWLRERAVILSYEELSQAPQALFERVLFPFLTLPVSPVKNTLKKQNPKSLRELIRNYDEIVSLDRHPSTFQHYHLPPIGESDAFAREGQVMIG